MRGYPGSGKTTLAKEIAKTKDAVIVSADDFHVNKKTGKYEFEQSKAYLAHKVCYQNFVRLVCLRKNVIIDNTNTTYSEFKEYLKLISEVNEIETEYKYVAKIVNVKYNSLEKAIEIRSDENKLVSEKIIREMNDRINGNDVVKEVKKNYPDLLVD